MSAGDEGRKAYAEKRYGDAVGLFGEALADAEPEEAAKIYSNRAACYMQMKDFKRAAEDAEAATQLTPQWAKGWARLGTARLAQGRTAEAAAALNKAAELDPSYERDALRARTSSSSSSYQSPQKKKKKTPAQLFVGLVVLYYAARYVVSFDPASIAKNYKNILKFAAMGSVVSTYRAHGFELSKAYLQKIITDRLVHRGFCALILFAGTSFVPLVPLLYVEVALVAEGLVPRLPNRYGLSLIAACEGYLLSGNGDLSPQVHLYAAYLEVAAGLGLLVELLTPKRNVILVVLYWQYLQMRYMLEQATGGGSFLAVAFSNLDDILAPLAARSSVTNLLYAKLKSLAKTQVSLPEPGTKPKLCSIM
ncbi:hypothetical protein CTAYLR_000601 [Chrysophaeum taylorii]|uniref:Uncharacterized protein n=1 Tax=Chrysophaeum taylorii TaxID=2483200 RepID=A0AAD7UGW1_9STRA|nr:hypothetical protein CTAYLR_000601 [Chrysophaeum taylorii]